MKITDKYVFFWNGIYSNWYPCNFTVGGMSFNCSEQWMMFCKAVKFDDFQTADQIMKSHSPKEQKALGRKVKNFDLVKWNKVCIDLVTQGCLEKFRQNKGLKDLIFIHGEGRNFVEASPYDVIWGIGMGEGEEGIENPNNWKGKNYLGIVLDRVYETLLKEKV